MLGAIIGDVVGSRFEQHAIKSTDFELFTAENNFSDDSVCTIAIADWLLTPQSALSPILQKWCRRYRHLPAGGYGRAFQAWIDSDNPQAYNSYGNGSAMRVSAVAWYFNDLDTVLEYARQSAEITHNHPEGIKGAQAIAAAIFLARKNATKTVISDFISINFAYDLSMSCDEIRPNYQFDSSCHGSVPQAIIAFLESYNFENALRLAISLGGDSDTLAAMAGSIAEAYYGDIPQTIRDQTLSLLPSEFIDIINHPKLNH